MRFRVARHNLRDWVLKKGRRFLQTHPALAGVFEPLAAVLSGHWNGQCPPNCEQYDSCAFKQLSTQFCHQESSIIWVPSQKHSLHVLWPRHLVRGSTFYRTKTPASLGP